MEKKPTAAEAYFSKEDRKKFLEVEEAALLLIEKIENTEDESSE